MVIFNKGLSKVFILVIIATLLLSAVIGCSDGSSDGGFGFQNPIVVMQPDIRVEDARAESGWNLSLGWYADVTYTLHNYGEANGQATIEIYGNSSGVLLTQVVVVSAQQTIVRTAGHVNRSSSDDEIGVRMVGQIKLQ